MKKPVVVYQEEISDCGVACLSSIIKYYGGYTNMETLRIDSNTTTRGVTAYDLIECAKKNGFNAAGYKDYDINKYSLPCIMHIKINQSLSHFVVLYGLKKSTLLIMDPAKGLVRLDKNSFDEIFTGNIIVLEPKSSLPNKRNINVIKNEIIANLKNHKSTIIKITILEIIFIFLSLISSFYIKIYNYEKYIVILSVIFIFINVLIEIISYMIYKKTINLENKISTNLSNYFFNHVLCLPLKYLHLKDPGEIVKRANEISTVNELVLNSIFTITINMLIITSSVPFIFIIDKLSLLIVIIQVSLVSLLSLLVMKKIKARSKEAIDAATEHNNLLIDGIYGLTSLKHSGGSTFFKERMNNTLTLNLEKERRYNLYLKKYDTIKSSLLSLMRIIINIFLIAKIYENHFSFELLIIIISFIEITSNSASNIISSFMELTFVRNINQKANDFYNIKETNNISSLKFKNGDINLKNINYTYHNYPIIKNFTTNIKKGEKVIIKGESGKGKSTLCKILYREITSYTGTIKIGGKDIRTLNSEDYLNNVTYSSQTERILNGSIKDNILLGRNITDEKLNEIISLCELTRVTKKRTFGIDTPLFSGGEELSGGERQLVILARALVSEFEILILDETLSEVNDEVEDEILKNLFKYFKDKTIIYVTHKNKKNYFQRIINV